MAAQPRPYFKSINLLEIAVRSDRSKVNDLVEGFRKPRRFSVEKDEAHFVCGSFMRPINRKRSAEALTLNFLASVSI